MSNPNDETELNMTVEEFAQWLLELPPDIRQKQIWFIDITRPYKGKPLNVEESPTGEYVMIEDD